MAKRIDIRAVVLSIHEASGDFADQAQRRDWETAARDLAARLQDAGLAATWATSNFGEPQHPEQTFIPAHHEWALDMTTAWRNIGLTRAQRSADISRRMADALGVGQQPQTLFAGDTLGVGHLDLLVKHGLHAVVGPAPRRQSRWRSVSWWPRTGGSMENPRPLRWGVWHWQPEAELTEVSSRGLRQTAARADAGAMAHLAVELRPHASARTGRLQQRALQSLARLCHHGGIESLTIGGAMRRITESHCCWPAYSILRPAA